MKKRIISIMLCIAMVISLVGCGSKNTAKQTSDTSDKGSTATTTTAAATTMDGITVGPVDGKSANDYKFAGVFGAVNPYSDPMQGAADQAAKELGIPATEFNAPQDWEQNEQNTILDGLISKGIKGIYMMTSDPVAGNEQIEKMVSAGIPIVCVGGSPETPSKATLTLATDVYKSAYDGTVNLIKAMGEKGNVVGLTGAVTDTNTQLRMKAIKAACKEYPNVTLFQMIGDIDDSEKSVTAIENVLAANGDKINGFISTAYYPSVALATILADKKYAGICAVGTDTDEKVLQAIKNGTMTGTMSQNPWGQAYLATITLKMLVDGWTYKDDQKFLVNSGSFYVTKDNVDNLDQVIQEETKKMAANWSDRFNAPTK